MVAGPSVLLPKTFELRDHFVPKGHGHGYILSSIPSFEDLGQSLTDSYL